MSEQLESALLTLIFFLAGVGASSLLFIAVGYLCFCGAG